MTVFDCCMFFNENDVYEIRLNEHWDFVDKFIVVEAGETHTGVKKPYNFDHERFKQYSEKIVYRSFDSFDSEMQMHPQYSCATAAEIHSGQGRPIDWARAHFQDNYAFKVLTDLGAKDDDIVYNSSLDEILNKEIVLDALNRFLDKDALYPGYNFITQQPITDKLRPIFGFELRLYVYKFNLLRYEALTAGLMTEVGTFKRILPGTARSLALTTHPPMKNGGWHFTYADSTNGEGVLQKHRSWAHAHDTGGNHPPKARAASASPEESLELLYKEFPVTKVAIGPGTHPQYLLDNLAKFDNYILKD